MFTEVNGLRMHYEQEGSGPDVVFIHGLGSSARDWEEQIPAFRDRYRVTTLDLRGFGQTDKPEGPYSMDGMARDVIGLLAALNIESAHILGLSLGGMVGQWVAILAPERVRSLTLSGTCAKLWPKGVDHAISLLMRIILIPIREMPDIARHVSHELFPEPQQAELRAQAYERISQNHLPSFRAAARAIRTFDTRPYLPGLRTPTLILCGDEDPIVPLGHSKELHRLIPGSRYEVITMSRHASNIDQPAKWNALARGFVDGVS